MGCTKSNPASTQLNHKQSLLNDLKANPMTPVNLETCKDWNRHYSKADMKGLFCADLGSSTEGTSRKKQLPPQNKKSADENSSPMMRSYSLRECDRLALAMKEFDDMPSDHVMTESPIDHLSEESQLDEKSLKENNLSFHGFTVAKLWSQQLNRRGAKKLLVEGTDCLIAFKDYGLCKIVKQCEPEQAQSSPCRTD